MAAIGEQADYIAGAVWVFIAFCAALAGCVAMIGGEMYAYKQAALALSEREWGAATLSFVLALVCTGLVVYAVYTGESMKPLISAVAVSVIVYMVMAVRDYRFSRNTFRAKQHTQTVLNVAAARDDLEKERAYNLELERQKTAQVRAQARSGAFASNGTPNTAHRAEKDPVLLERVREYLAEHPNASIREIMGACGFRSTSTAKSYKDAVTK